MLEIKAMFKRFTADKEQRWKDPASTTQGEDMVK